MKEGTYLQEGADSISWQYLVPEKTLAYSPARDPDSRVQQESAVHARAWDIIPGSGGTPVPS